MNGKFERNDYGLLSFPYPTIAFLVNTFPIPYSAVLCQNSTIPDSTLPLQYLAILCHCFHSTRLCFAIPRPRLTILFRALPTPCKTATMLNYTSPFRHFAILHSSLAMQVNSLLFTTEQYHDITIPVSAMPLQHLTFQCISNT